MAGCFRKVGDASDCSEYRTERERDLAASDDGEGDRQADDVLAAPAVQPVHAR